MAVLANIMTFKWDSSGPDPENVYGVGYKQDVFTSVGEC